MNNFPKVQDSPKTLTQRLLSIDVFRGFCMFYILYYSGRGKHAPWEGLTFDDLFFPWFIFVVGISIALSSAKKSNRSQSKKPYYFRLVKRTIILFALGIICNGGFSSGLMGVRILGVLQRIALCYLFSGIIFYHFHVKGQLIWLTTLLLGYWALLALVPVPGFGAGNFTAVGNLSTYIDQIYLPGKKLFYRVGMDPEGLLSTIPAIGTCLMGVLCGQLVLLRDQTPQRKVYILIWIGTGSILLGYIWGLSFPIIKNIWTSSYALITVGFGFIIFAIFYQIIEVFNFKKWSFPFMLFGLNPLAIYVADKLINFRELTQRFVGSHDVFEIVRMTIMFSLLYWLYKRKIFIRL
jgi:predicted acyltransferase